jgi:hypothetical protein
LTPFLLGLGTLHFTMSYNPDHYTYSDIQPFDVVKAWNLNFFEGNIAKYLCRAGKKPGVEKLTDYKKMQRYLEEMIDMEEKRLSTDTQ